MDDQCFSYERINIQWGSEYQAFQYRKHLKNKYFEARFSNGLVFRWSGYNLSHDHLKTDQNGGHFEKNCLVFKWLG